MSPVTAFNYSHTIGFYAQNGRGFNNPVDMALGHNGRLYVLNRAGSDVSSRMSYKRVTMCSIDEIYYGEFTSGGTDDGQMMWPAAIVGDAADHLYISDEALHRIAVFDREGQFQYHWGTRGAGEGEFNRPAGLAFDANAHLLVVDGLNHRVQRYRKDGTFLGQWGQAGTEEGALRLPWGIATDANNDVYIADWGNDRIQKFDVAGRHLASFGTSGAGEGEFRRPSGVAVDADGLIIVADWGNERVQILDPDGRFLAALRGESGLSSWATEYFISNQDELEERELANMEPELDLRPDDEIREESASIEKLFWGPISVKADPQGRLYIVESCRHRIQVYQKTAA